MRTRPSPRAIGRARHVSPPPDRRAGYCWRAAQARGAIEKDRERDKRLAPAGCPHNEIDQARRRDPACGRRRRLRATEAVPSPSLSGLGGSAAVPPLGGSFVAVSSGGSSRQRAVLMQASDARSRHSFRRIGVAAASKYFWQFSSRMAPNQSPPTPMMFMQQITSCARAGVAASARAPATRKSPKFNCPHAQLFLHFVSAPAWRHARHSHHFLKAPTRNRNSIA